MGAWQICMTKCLLDPVKEITGNRYTQLRRRVARVSLVPEYGHSEENAPWGKVGGLLIIHDTREEHIDFEFYLRESGLEQPK